jgi:ribosome-associated translation inhibitor RaiA
MAQIRLYMIFGGILLIGLILSFILPIKWFIFKKENEGFEERKGLKIRYLKNDPWRPEQMREWNTKTKEEITSLKSIQDDTQSLFKRYQTILESQAVGAVKQYESWKVMTPELRKLSNQHENPVETFYKVLIDPEKKTSRVLGSQSMKYDTIIFQNSLPLIVIPEAPIAPSLEISPETTGVDRDIVEIPFYEKVPSYLVNIPTLLPTLQSNLSRLQESIAGKSKDPSKIPEYSLYERIEELRISTEKAKRDANTLKISSTEGFNTETQTQTQTQTLDIVVPNFLQTIHVIDQRNREVYASMKKVLEELERKMTKTEQTLKDLQEDAEKVKQANS